MSVCLHLGKDTHMLEKKTFKYVKKTIKQKNDAE